MSQVILFDLGDIDSVIADLTFLNIVETVDQVGDGSFSCTCGAYEGKLLAGLCKETDILKDYFIRVIAEGYILEADISCKFCIGYGAVSGMRMLPCPHAGSFFAFCDISLSIFFRINKLYITFIFFRLLIDQVEDSFSTCKGHDNGIELLCHLHEGLGKALCELQVRGHDTQSDAAYSCYREKSSQNCCEYELQVTDISDDRTHHVGVFVGVGGAFKESFIQAVKFLFGFCFMVENLNNPLAVHALFHKSGHICQRYLLTDEIFTTVCPDLTGHCHHNEDNSHSQDGQQWTEHQHGDKGYDNGEQCHQSLRDCLADHLSQCICIIGVETHDGAVGILVEVTDRQSLHMLKHIVTDALQHALSDKYHHSAVNKGCDHPYCENAAQNCHCLVQLCIIGVCLSDQRDNIIIQQIFQGQGYGNAGYCTEKDTDKYQYQPQLIGFGYIFQKSFGSFDGVMVYFFLLIHLLRLL